MNAMTHDTKALAEIVTVEQQGTNFFVSFPYNQNLVRRFHQYFKYTTFLNGTRSWVVARATKAEVEAWAADENKRAEQGLEEAFKEPLERNYLKFRNGQYVLSGYSKTAAAVCKLLGGRFQAKDPADKESKAFWVIPGVFHGDLSQALPVLDMALDRGTDD